MIRAFLAITFFSQMVFSAATPAKNREQFCANRKIPNYYVELAHDNRNHLSFQNQGGLINGGVCWWHSLFQRASFYLAVYRPELPKPTEKEAKAIVHSLAAGKKVVEIPGYHDMNSFSRDWQKPIQAKLEQWQKVDGFLKFKWIEGLSGSTMEKPEKIASLLDGLLADVETKKEIQWTMLQLKGIPSHSALVLHVEKTPALYTTKHLDSNYVGRIESFAYKIGDTHFYEPGYGRFVMYPGRKKDLQNFKVAADNYCNGTRVVVDERLDNSWE